MAIEPELADTCAWLRALSSIAVEFQRYDGTADPAVAACARKALERIDRLQGIERELPRIHQTMLALARRESVPEESAVVLRSFQEALVDVGRAMIHVRRVHENAFGATSLPPYDQWLPFKDGIGAH